MSAIDRIREMVRTGAATPAQGAMLLELVRDVQRRRARAEFWASVVDGLTLGPLWRWLRRTWRRA